MVIFLTNFTKHHISSVSYESAFFTQSYCILHGYIPSVLVNCHDDSLFSYTKDRIEFFQHFNPRYF